MPLNKKLLPFIDANYPILYIHSYEEMKVYTDIVQLAKDENKRKDIWSLVVEDDLETFLLDYVKGLESLDEVFIILKDVHSFLDEKHPNNQKIVALLKELVHRIMTDDDSNANIIIISSILTIPKELEKFITVFELELPTFDEIKIFVQSFSDEQDANISSDNLKRLATYLKGLTQQEIEMLLRMAIQENGTLGGSDDEKLILNEKQQIIKKSGILEMITTNLTLDDIGGLDNLKEWLKNKSKVFKDIKKAKEYGVDTPKGAFIVGMPGCGKSLTAKATAILFDNIPLLRLDIGRLMGKYVGESESNMRKAISQAEAISPSILWIDEIEKAFTGIGQGGSGSEVATRLFGFFLTWMQEKTSEVYVIATANDISNLPPELLRKGRFDEVFFVDFPNETERKQIFKVHIKNRKNGNKHIDSIDFSNLAKETKGYSGADIETVVKETIEYCYINKIEIATTKNYLDSIKSITSISEMLPEKIEDYNNLKEKMKVKSAT